MSGIIRVFYAKRAASHSIQALTPPDGWEIVSVQTIPLEDGCMGFTLVCRSVD